MKLKMTIKIILTLFNSRYGTPGSITKEYEEFSEYYCKSFAGKSVGSYCTTTTV